MLTFIVLFSVC